MFQPLYRCLKKIGRSKRISAWKSKDLSDKSLKPLFTSNNSLSPAINLISNEIREIVDKSCLKQGKPNLIIKL